MDNPTIRVADEEREQVAQELREHLLAGRLRSEEFEERVAKAYGAVTKAELDAVKADLPMSSAALGAALTERRAKLRRRIVEESGGAAALWALCVGVWLISGADGSFWPAWVILVTALPIVRNAWRLLGPEPDLESVEAHLDASREKRLARERHRAARQRRLPR